MERIIKAIEEKLASQETTIYLQKHEIDDLKRKLKEAEEKIKSQEFLLSEFADGQKLKGASA
jgi:septal ring factor EnvC (AmiA/AmiB activator)